MKNFEVITIFPEVIAPYAETSILGKAQKKELIKITAHDLRAYSTDLHKKVDGTPYGGGAGMVMSVQPFDSALKAVRSTDHGSRVILLSASGKRFTQADAKRLAGYDQLIFLCGRYEGVDARVEAVLADEALSIGDYVLTGGELPALVIIDAVARNIEGVLGNDQTLLEESHGEDGLLEYPQYTKPPIYRINNTDYPVPEILLSGDHEKIRSWRQKNKRKKT